LTDKLEFKAMSGQLSIDEAEGVVECFVAALGNKDSVGDVVVPGAFSASLKRRKPRVVWGHDWNQPIGKVLDIYEVGPSDPRLPGKMKAAGVGGLFAKVQFNLRSERGREAFHSILFFGEEQEWSIGYKTLDSIYSPERQANMLKEVELYEVSPVLHGANQLTATISIKSEKQDAKDNRLTSFRESKWETFDPSFAEMIKEKYPSIWRKGGNIRGNDQYAKLLPLYRRGGTANSEMEINALELREAWVARHKGDFRIAGVVAQIKWLAVGSRGEAYMKNLVREEIKKIEQKSDVEGDVKGGGVSYSNYTSFADSDDLGGYEYNGGPSEEKAEEEEGCPPATSDIQINLKNRQKAIDSVGYGPLNPSEPNAEFWAEKADQWDVSPDEAKKQRCGNCAAFVKTEQMLACIEKGLGNEPGNDAIDVIKAGDLGYCEALDFKCAAARTCDAWISGGPVTGEEKGYGYEETEKPYEDEPKGYGYGGPEGQDSSDDDPMEELERMAMMMGDPSMGPKEILTRALAKEFDRPVRIRTATGNTVVFDAMSDSGKKMTARASWHAERGQVMIGRPERVRVETVYIPIEGDSGGQAYEGDSEKDSGCGCGGKGSCGSHMKSEEILFVPLGYEVEVKAPTPVDAIPQERITGDVMRGYGPRRGNLEKLLRYWRPIMRKPGGFRRCRVILADHPELYPLNNICAWLHHETTGLWPNEGCHHPGMKNCRRKLRGVVRGSLFSDGEFNDRLRKLKPNPDGKGMDYEEDDDMEVSMDEAVGELKMFCKAEPNFIKMLRDEAAWEHEGEDEVGMKNVHSTDYAKEDCNCDHSAGDSDIFSDSLKGLFEDIDLKAGRAINGRNVEKIRKVIAMLEEIVGASSPIESVEMKSDGLIVAPTENIPLVGDAITPVASYYNFEIELTDSGIQVADFSDLSEDAKSAIDTALGSIIEIQRKSAKG
jgi:HK97 family phage prohead protease